MKRWIDAFAPLIVTAMAVIGILSVFGMDAAKEDELQAISAVRERDRLRNELDYAAICSAKAKYDDATWRDHLAQEYERMWGVPYGEVPDPKTISLPRLNEADLLASRGK